MIRKQRTKIKDVLASEKPVDSITVMGWVRTKRDSKDFSFVELNDGSTPKNIQIIAEGSLKNYEEVKKLTTGASVKVVGALVESPASGQKFEIKAKEIEIFCFADPMEYPLQKKGIPFEKLREVAHLRPRTNTFAAMARVRHHVAMAIHKFFDDRGFVYVHTPIITGSDCEGAGEMFRVSTLDPENLPKTKEGKVDYSKDFFGKPTYLTVSGQLDGEMFALAVGDIYTFGPTFRAENSNTSRHASEFWMIEPEMAFYDLEDLMDLEEEFVRYIIQYCFDHCMDDLEFFDKWIEKGLIDALKHVLESKFARVTYEEATKILEGAEKSGKTKFEVKPGWDVEMGAEHERYLTEKHFKVPIILHNFPKEFKAFYMYQNDDGKTLQGTDVLVPRIGEITGGSVREHRLDKLKALIEEKNLDMKQYEWYLDTRKFGSVPHAGFGLGFERLVMFLTGMKNIRDIIPFPRTPGNAEF